MSEQQPIGILAYGSLLNEPGDELQKVIERNIESVQTPFAVEYARSSSHRGGAPTLVPVQPELAGPVTGQIMLLRGGIDFQTACDYLYRRERGRVGDLSLRYNDRKQHAKPNGVWITRHDGLGGVSIVLATKLDANISEVLDVRLPAGAKAEKLADLAIQSLQNPEVVGDGRDGIQYLIDNLEYGIRTRLTDAYCEALLRRAGDAPDLAAAREWLLGGRAGGR
jgi:hypothetical protein